MAVGEQTIAIPTRAQPYPEGPVLTQGWAQALGDGTGGNATLEVFLDAKPSTIHILETLYVTGAAGGTVVISASAQFITTPTSAFVSPNYIGNITSALEVGAQQMRAIVEQMRLIIAHPGVPNLVVTALFTNATATWFRLGVTAWQYDLTATAAARQLRMSGLGST